MFKFGLIALAALASLEVNCLEQQDSVQVQLYYETLCPGSKRFIILELHPAYVALGSETIKLELIPYGFASETEVDGTKTFTCQHGPGECYGNKVHACSLDLNPIEKNVDFFYCASNTSTPVSDRTFEKCAESTGISWADIKECTTNGKGDELLTINGEKTRSVSPRFVPTAVVDGVYNEEDAMAMVKDFKKFICDKLGNPDKCKQ